ncbi:hypothetical protein [Coxiella-like endosymbiont]
MVITQYFYSCDAYFYFVESCQKLKYKCSDYSRNYAN